MRAATVIATLALGVAQLAHAGEEPLWEGGIGIASLYFPDYRGASHARFYVLPAPYLVYRGDLLKADRSGVRGVFVAHDRFDMDMSVGASLPVDSSKSPERVGMPDLRPTIEVGPSLEVNLWRTDDRRMKLDLRMPVRAAVTVESHPRFIGGQFYPHVNLDVADPAGLKGWNLGMQAGPVYTDARYNRYFYAVAPEFATPDRPAYTPSGGFAGTQALVAVSKRFPKFWIGAFARYDMLDNAHFAASPLVSEKRYFAAGVAIAWVVGESKERVPVDALGNRMP